MINPEIVKKFIKKALEELDGEWVIIGGTVLSLLGIEDRITIDIDLISLKNKKSNSQTLKLMNIAESLGLPVETINQSGEFYLHKIPNFIHELEIYSESKKCKIYRPNAFLFFYLKLARLSETDASDCISFMKYNKNETLIHKVRILKLIKSNLKSISKEKESRLLELHAKVQKLS